MADYPGTARATNSTLLCGCGFVCNCSSPSPPHNKPKPRPLFIKPNRRDRRKQEAEQRKVQKWLTSRNFARLMSRQRMY